MERLHFSQVWLLLLHCLVLGVLSSDFETLHKRQLANTPLKLDDKAFDDLTAAPRNFTAAVYLTALDARFGCQVCKEFHGEWDILAKSWVNGDRSGQSRVVFATIDFIEGRSTFQKLGLQTAPMLQLYGPTIGPGAQPGAALETYDFKAGSVSAEVLQAWIAKHVPLEPKPAVKRPVNYTKWVIASTIVLGILSFAKIAWSYVLPIMQNRNLWAAISLVLILLFTSGHMFNHIRKTPYVSGDGKGGISYFAGGFQNQFGLETQIVAAIYAVLSFATIALALRVPRILNPKTQAVATWVWVGVMFLTYGYLMSVFRKKNGGYPFWLPPFTN